MTIIPRTVEFQQVTELDTKLQWLMIHTVGFSSYGQLKQPTDGSLVMVNSNIFTAI